MDYEKMELNELKEYAKSIGLSVGNIGKEKLIAKIQEKETAKVSGNNSGNDSIKSVLEDDDIKKEPKIDNTIENEPESFSSGSLLDSISSAIDDLEDSTGSEIEEIVDLPNSHIVRVKSITYGGLTYRSRTTNAVFRWNQIGAVQDMTIAELNEMNNYKTDFLRKPLVILMDEDAIKKFRLTSVYENVAKINNLKQVFASDLTTIERTINIALQVNMRDILVSKVTQMMKNKTLVDINVIKLLSKRLSYDFEEILEQ